MFTSLQTKINLSLEILKNIDTATLAERLSMNHTLKRVVRDVYTGLSRIDYSTCNIDDEYDAMKFIPVAAVRKFGLFNSLDHDRDWSEKRKEFISEGALYLTKILQVLKNMGIDKDSEAFSSTPVFRFIYRIVSRSVSMYFRHCYRDYGRVKIKNMIEGFRRDAERIGIDTIDGMFKYVQKRLEKTSIKFYCEETGLSQESLEIANEYHLNDEDARIIQAIMEDDKTLEELAEEFGYATDAKGIKRFQRRKNEALEQALKHNLAESHPEYVNTIKKVINRQCVRKQVATVGNKKGGCIKVVHVSTLRIPLGEAIMSIAKECGIEVE